ncbi:hypothetical protein KZ779_06980 [Escherichia coli]|nr:hypothetical protein [Escherichia coli]
MPALLVLSPVVFAADEQTMIVSAAPQVVSELDTPSSSKRGGWRGDAPLATPRINLSESLTGVHWFAGTKPAELCARFTAVDSRIWLPLHLRYSRYFASYVDGEFPPPCPTGKGKHPTSI